MYMYKLKQVNRVKISELTASDQRQEGGKSSDDSHGHSHLDTSQNTWSQAELKKKRTKQIIKKLTSRYAAGRCPKSATKEITS